MKKWFAFEVRSGVDQRGKDTYYWVVTSKYATQKEVFAAYNTPHCRKKVNTVYTLKQLFETKGKAQTKYILEKTYPHWMGEYDEK